MGVVNVIVKHLVLSHCAVDGHSTNPLYYCYISDEHVYILILCVSDVICFCSFMKEEKICMPMAHLRKGALRPYCYYFIFCLMVSHRTSQPATSP